MTDDQIVRSILRKTSSMLSISRVHSVYSVSLKTVEGGFVDAIMTIYDHGDDAPPSARYMVVAESKDKSGGAQTEGASIDAALRLMRWSELLPAAPASGSTAA